MPKTRVTEEDANGQVGMCRTQGWQGWLKDWSGGGVSVKEREELRVVCVFI